MRMIFLSLACCAFAATSDAKDLSISMMYSNAIAKTLPFDLVTKGRWEADPQARFVKLHMYMDTPIHMTGAEIDRCDTSDVSNGRDFSVFINFDEWAFRASDDYEVPVPEVVGRRGKTYEMKGFDPTFEVRSLTWNFEKVRGVALCGLRIFDEDGKPYSIKVPQVAGGQAHASSTLAPVDAYDVMNLFDSRFEYAWASNKQSRGVELAFAFDQPQRIEKLRIWSGYQRSPTHCYSNSRPKVLRLTGEGGYSERVEIADAMGSQLVTLPKAFQGRRLTVRIEDSYVGKAYSDVVISELRFGNGNSWFILDPLPHQLTTIAANRTAFKNAGLEGALNEGLSEEGEGTLRLRADGSFYLSGEGEDKSKTAIQFFALGNYEVLPVSAANGLRLRLFGLYYPTKAYGDCNGCGRDCNRVDQKFGDKIFQEFVTLRKDDAHEEGEAFFLENASGGKKLPFKKVWYLRDSE